MTNDYYESTRKQIRDIRRRIAELRAQISGNSPRRSTTRKDGKVEEGDASMGWCINFPLGKYNFKDNVKGFKLCDYVGTGFMCIKREVFETIIKKYPEIEYLSDINAKIDNKQLDKGKKEYAFFDCGIQGQGVLSDPDKTKRYLSEDFYFCQLWKQCGGQIWSDITILFQIR